LYIILKIILYPKTTILLYILYYIKFYLYCNILYLYCILISISILNDILMFLYLCTVIQTTGHQCRANFLWRYRAKLFSTPIKHTYILNICCPLKFYNFVCAMELAPFATATTTIIIIACIGTYNFEFIVNWRL